MTGRRILFVMRDGALLREAETLSLVPRVIPALLELGDAGFALVAITTQASPTHGAMVELLASQGVQFEKILECPRDPGRSSEAGYPDLERVLPYIRDRAVDLDGSRVIAASQDLEARALADAMGVEACGLGSSEHPSWPAIAAALIRQPRRSKVRRVTKETAIDIAVDLDGRDGLLGAPGSGTKSAIHTGIGFFDHMLEQLAKHSGIAMSIQVDGDLHIDEHHTVEDTALTLGQALREALGSKVGIGRYGFVLPMDEAQARVAIDLSGRPYLVWQATIARESVGGLPTELVPHFFRSLADTLGATLHIHVEGDNAHHIIECAFKGVARALRQAVGRTGGGLPSTKGTL